VGFYLFIIHMLTTTEQRFVSPALFKDRNFLIGNLFMFIVGVILFATLALLPPLLQDLLNYPVVTAGLVTSPRGVGTLIAMFIVGRLMGKVDIRLIIGAGSVERRHDSGACASLLAGSGIRVKGSGILSGVRSS
jgi:MFS transporter, DHA2 family, multidrug resistance protein